MPNFHYTAKTKDNHLQSGDITAADRAAAIKALTERHLQPIVVKAPGRSKDIRLRLPWAKNKVKSEHLVIMTRQLATMVNAGVPLVRSLETLKDQTDSDALKATLEDIIAKVEDGGALSAALAAHPKVFNEVYVNMVRAGESGGILDKILDRLAFQLEKASNIKGKVRGAMIYPSVILVVTLAAFYFLMTGIVPKLKSIFDEFGGKLPLYTRVLLAISSILQHYGLIIILVSIGLFIAFLRYTRKPAGKLRWHKVLLKMPILGKILLKVNVAQFARTFSSLTAAGVSVLDGLTVTSGALSNVVVQNAVKTSVTEVRNGQPISAALESTRIMPPIVWQMIAVGEETGQVDVVLAKVADFYEEEVDRVVASITSIIEPLLIIVLGGMVGVIAASVFGPISNLNNIIQ